MASIPRPSSADGIAVGAEQGLSATDFESGTLHNIQDFGAVMDGTTDDSAAIADAIQHSADNGGAAYIPEGTAFVDGWHAVSMAATMSGGALVGEGADSLILGNSAAFGFPETGYTNIHFANFRIDAGSGTRCIHFPDDNSAGAEDLVFENLWVHGGDQTNFVCKGTVSHGNTFATLRDLDVYNCVQHGVGLDVMGATVHVESVCIWECGLNDDGKAGIGLDCSGEYVNVFDALIVDCQYGTKTTGDTVSSEYHNVYVEGTTRIGMYASGSASAPNILLDTFVTKQCDWEGYSLRASDWTCVDGTTLYGINNCLNANPPDGNASLEFAEGASLDASNATVEICGTRSGQPGLTDTTSDSSGTIDHLIASDNDGGNVSSASGITINTLTTDACDAPTPEQLFGTWSGSGSGGTGAGVNVHDGSAWQGANVSVRATDAFQSANVGTFTGDETDGGGTTTTVLEDWEAGSSALDNYAESVSDAFTVSNVTTLEGSYALEDTTTSQGALVYDGSDGTTQRGYDYRIQLHGNGGDHHAWLLVGDQYPSTGGINDDNYHARVETGNNRLLVGKWKGSSYATWDDVNPGLGSDRMHSLGLRWGATGTTGNIEAYLLADDGSELASVAISDDEFTGGTWGIYTGSNLGSLYDYATERSL